MGELDNTFLSHLAAGSGVLIDEDRACAKCGYSLLGLRTDGVCPECGSPIRLGSGAGAEHFSAARRCRKCGRDIEGLHPGDACPGCGTVVQAVMPFGKLTAMGDAPRPWLGRLRLGCGLMALGGFGYSVLPSMVFAWSTGDILKRFFGHLIAPPKSLGSTTPTTPNAKLFTLAALGLSVCWAIGVWLMTRPRPQGTFPNPAYDPKREWLAWRWVARGGAVLGAAAAGLLWVCASGGSVGVVSLWFLLGGLAVIPAMVYLSGLLFWAAEDALAWGVRGGVTLMSVAMLVFVVVALPGGEPFRLMAVFAGMVFMLGSVFGQFASLKTVTSIGWAIRHAEDAAARDERRRKKAEEERRRARAEREVELATGTGTAMTPDQEAMLAEIERKHRASMEHTAREGETPSDRPMPGRQHVVESGDNVETFGLEGDAGSGSERGSGA